VSLAAAAVVVVAVGLGIRSLRPSVTEELSGIRVERVTNAAWARHGSLPLFRSKAPLHVGSVVSGGYEVMTGDDARVALRAPTGHSLRLDTDTTLRVISNRVFALERGAVYVESAGGTALPGTSLRIDTVVGTIEDLGTQFEVRLDGGSLSLQVREGAVTLQVPAERVVAHAGESLRLNASGRIVRTEDAGAGGGWTWVEAIAPMMEIEGRSLLEFLDWIARERGVRLQFSDTGLAEKAPTIVLRGSIAGMTLEQATTSVLTTCGLTHRGAGGDLIVGANQESRRSP
jgi:ferric-dicitrate binding protein FerR (iron transport regulator)